MNYLAHLYLADPTPESLLGNLIADFVKRPEAAALSPGIQAGIRLHRQVDAFTDRHPVVQRSITRISELWGWYSGILIDVYYDHILATSWGRYSAESLRDFVERVHGSLAAVTHTVAGEARYLIERLIETDRLYSYTSAEGIEEALFRIAGRIRERIPRHAVRLELAMPDLRANHAELTTDFHDFFPQLAAFARSLV